MKMADQERDWTTTGDARCNFCNGTMPCYCPPPKDLDRQYEEDSQIRDKVDLPHEA